MGRGRTGFGTMRWSHVKLKVEVIDFDEVITKSETTEEKQIWIKRKALVEKLKLDPQTYVIQGKKPSRRSVTVPEQDQQDEEQQQQKK